MELLLLDLDTFSDADYRAAYALLPADKRARVDRMRLEADRQRSVAGDFLARRLLARATGLSPAAIEIQTGPNGKPWVDWPNTHLSIAHAQRFVVCAIDTAPVGVDIERVRPLSPNLIQRFFSPEEAVYVRADASGRRGICLWTRKEAYVKLRGGTIWREGRLDLHPVAGRLPACAAGCLFENQEPAPGYILGLCQQSDPIGRQIQ